MSAQPEADASDEKAVRVPRRRYSSLAGSPYDVNQSSLRERYWFSDGAWVDQGQTAAVVGVVWTHWLADRGLQVPGTKFDEAFARDLYFASQQAMGRQDGSLANALNVAGTAPAQADASAREKVRDVVDKSLSLDNPEVQEVNRERPSSAC
jgi:hypothetical protein